MLIVHKDYDNIFDDDVIATVYKDNMNYLYGFVTKKGVELYRPLKSKKHEMYINHKIYERMRALYYKDADKRVNILFECTYEFTDVDTNDTYYYIEYTDDDLLK